MSWGRQYSLMGGHYSLVNNVWGDILWGDTVNYDTGYVLKWMIKASHLRLRFGALFVGSMRLEIAGPKTSPGHGPIVQATI